MSHVVTHQILIFITNYDLVEGGRQTLTLPSGSSSGTRKKGESVLNFSSTPTSLTIHESGTKSTYLKQYYFNLLHKVPSTKSCAYLE